jgi:hypothetical protein
LAITGCDRCESLAPAGVEALHPPPGGGLDEAPVDEMPARQAGERSCPDGFGDEIGAVRGHAPISVT